MAVSSPPYMKELKEYVKRIKEDWQAKMREIEQRRAETYRARKKKGAGRLRISAGERR